MRRDLLRYLGTDEAGDACLAVDPNNIGAHNDADTSGYSDLQRKSPGTGQQEHRGPEEHDRRELNVGAPCDAPAVVIEFEAELWIWDARRDESWTFVSLPIEESEVIRELAGGSRRGFGSVRVRVTLGGSTWSTSIFPAAEGQYVLPVKRAVRKAEGIEARDTAKVTVEVVDL